MHDDSRAGHEPVERGVRSTRDRDAAVALLQRLHGVIKGLRLYDPGHAALRTQLDELLKVVREMERDEVSLLGVGGYCYVNGVRLRPEEEIRPVLSALGGCSLDDALPALEAQLFESTGFLGGSTAHQQAVARCIARIGTPAAQLLLDCGARSRHASVREACKLAQRGSGHA